MHISFKVNGKETIVTLTDVRPIFVICIDSIYCLHKSCISWMLQSWPAEYSQLFITRFEIKNSRPGNKIHFLSKSDTKKFSSSLKKITSFLLFIYIEKKEKNRHVNNKQINKQTIKVNRWKQLYVPKVWSATGDWITHQKSMTKQLS